MKKKYKRLWFFIIFLGVFWSFSFFAIQSFRENLEYYLTPEQVFNLDLEKIDRSKKMRVGGLVISIEMGVGETKFVITDLSSHQMTVIYRGNDFPPIFRENVGVIARGHLIDKNTFEADSLIGKHDENYMPRKMKEKAN
jgi:cytochrome c-type biogenesis protein CcmE